MGRREDVGVVAGGGGRSMVEGWRSILPARQRAALATASAIERVALGACKFSVCV